MHGSLVCMEKNAQRLELQQQWQLFVPGACVVPVWFLRGAVGVFVDP